MNHRCWKRTCDCLRLMLKTWIIVCPVTCQMCQCLLKRLFSVSVPNSHSWLLKGRNYNILYQNMFWSNKMKSFSVFLWCTHHCRFTSCAFWGAHYLRLIFQTERCWFCSFKTLVSVVCYKSKTPTMPREVTTESQVMINHLICSSETTKSFFYLFF